MIVYLFEVFFLRIIYNELVLPLRKQKDFLIPWTGAVIIVNGCPKVKQDKDY